MTDSKRIPEADAYLSRVAQWREELGKLREIALDCGLDEVMKWGHPCYASDNRNIVLIHGFKDYCALLFFKGALLKDDHGLLILQTENVQAARQIRFVGVTEIVEKEALLKTYIRQAIAVEQAGLKAPFKTTAQFEVPEEFQNALDALPALKAAFAALTPGRQRAYLLHFAAAKQSKTRLSRIEKWTPRILEGKGLDD